MAGRAWVEAGRMELVPAAPIAVLVTGRLVGGIGIAVGGFEAAAGGWVARGAVDVDAASKGA